MGYTIHAPLANKNAYKGLITAEYVGIEVSTTKDFVMGSSNKTPEFLKLNPLGKIPVLETPEGPVWESNAIAKYIARQTDNALLGTTNYEKSLVDQWIDFATTEIDKSTALWVYPLHGFLPSSPEMEKYAIASVERALTTLNGYLAGKTYLVGDFITVADIIIFSNLILGWRTIYSKEFTAKFPHVERYFWTMANQPNVKKVVGEFAQQDKDPKAQAPAHGKPAAAQEAVKSKGGKQPPKVKEAAKPKEAPKAKEIPAGDEEEAPPKPKAKNPLDLLPPSTFVIDEWKRLYSNTKAKDFSEVAIKGFWEMFDPEGWSFWFADYKYNEENEKTYVTMNKVGGFLQRLDFIRKYAFGKMLILSDKAPYKIKGVWLFRGQEIPKQVMDECYDMELYTWTKADLSSSEQKERINAYFEEPDVVDGEKLLEAKCFK